MSPCPSREKDVFWEFTFQRSGDEELVTQISVAASRVPDDDDFRLSILTTAADTREEEQRNLPWSKTAATFSNRECPEDVNYDFKLCTAS